MGFEYLWFLCEISRGLVVFGDNGLSSSTSTTTATTSSFLPFLPPVSARTELLARVGSS